MQWFLRPLTAIVLTGMLASLAGCGAKERPFPVCGQLLYEDDGTPIKELAGFTVIFSSRELGLCACGQINDQGEFRLSSRNINDGAYPGQYQVMVTQPCIQAERGLCRKPVVDRVYERPQLCGLTASVERTENSFTFRLRKYAKH